MRESAEIVGAGLVTPLGDLPGTLAALGSGRAAPSAARPPAPPDDPAFRRLRKCMSRQATLAAAAARAAMAAADPWGRGFDPDRAGLFAGVGLASLDPAAAAVVAEASMGDDGAASTERFCRDALARVNPLWAFQTLSNMPACVVSILEGLRGESAVYTPWEDGSAQALCEAVEALSRGVVDLAVVTAVDTPDDPGALSATRARLLPGQKAVSAAAALVLARPGEAGPGPLPLVADFRLGRQDGPPDDPLAGLLGRSMAAAPVMLATLAALAPELGLATSMLCSGGHRLTFRTGTR
jgi:hypothetical protein